MENNNLLLSLWQARHQFDVVQLLLPWCSKLPSPPKTTNEFWFLFIKCIINSSSRSLFVFPSCSLLPEPEDGRIFLCGFAASGNFCSNFNIVPQKFNIIPQFMLTSPMPRKYWNCKYSAVEITTDWALVVLCPLPIKGHYSWRTFTIFFCWKNPNKTSKLDFFFCIFWIPLGLMCSWRQ